MKKITKYGENDYKIEETKSVKVVSTTNIKVLEKEIEMLKAEIDQKTEMLAGKEGLLKELKEIK